MNKLNISFTGDVSDAEKARTAQIVARSLGIQIIDVSSVDPNSQTLSYLPHIEDDEYDQRHINDERPEARRTQDTK
jgi:hypothetical protein